jgi:hypothetical protein
MIAVQPKDTLSLCWGPPQFLQVKHITQEWYLLDPELAFVELDVQLMLSQLLKYNKEVIFMFLHTL